MSTNENTPLPDDSSSFQLIGPPQPPPQSASKYLHALRRRWLMATGIGLLFAAVLGPAVWFIQTPKYTALAQVQVASREPVVVFQTADTAAAGPTQYDVYKSTQREVMRSPFLLVAALRKTIRFTEQQYPNLWKTMLSRGMGHGVSRIVGQVGGDETDMIEMPVSKLPLVEREVDEVAWLSEELTVGFLGDSEIMQVSLTLEDADQAAALVNAVVEAYMEQVVVRGREQRNRRLGVLDTAWNAKRQEVKAKRTTLRDLAKQLGTADTKAVQLKQQIALQQYASFAGELVRTQFELRRAVNEAKGQQAMLRTVGTREIPEYELNHFAQDDPAARQLLAELNWRTRDVAHTESVTVPGAVSPYAQRFRRDLQSVQQQYDNLGNQLRGNLLDKKRAEIAARIEQLEIEIAVLSEQKKQFEQDVEEKRKEAEEFGGQSLDIEMMRADIAELEQVLSGIAGEREKVGVEAESAPRISWRHRAQRPASEDRTARLALAIFAMLVGFCIPVGCVAWWDARGQRINTAEEVSKGLGLPVIGLVPVIPARVNRELGLRTGRYQEWEKRIAESVNGIAARLLHQADTRQTRVMLISSAVRGEGKTSLATRLAVSLARSGRNTVVVDFDLQHPGVHEAFGLDLGPGVSEVLRKQNEVAEVVHQIGTDKPSVVTAGRLDSQALVSLAKGAAEPLLKKLREDYEFVVIDASSVLDAADTQFVSRHVDSVILSVFRDISQAPKVSRVRETLEEYVQTVEAVVACPS